MKSFTRNLIKYVCLGIGLFVAVQGAVAQSGEALNFTCVVAKTSDGTNFSTMGRPVICPVTVSYKETGGWRSRLWINAEGISAACTIKSGETSCTGTISGPMLKFDHENQQYGTAQSLLTEAERLSGGVSVRPDYPTANIDPDIRQISVYHLYAFPTPTNPYHNAALPGDINVDGRVAPNDVALLGEFLSRNNWRVNLAALGKIEGTMPPFPDVNNDWQVTIADYQAVVRALNRK